MLIRYLAFLDLKDYQLRLLPKDLLAGLTVTFLNIPQGIAYAIIAGLPPVMGLYAAAVPTLVGALFRSSRHVVTGPSNALSLLVGSGVAAAVAHHGAEPMAVGMSLAFMVGILQLGAGLLRLDVLTDYVSAPVVRGYISGAAALIAVGQLHNVTGTVGSRGDLIHMLNAWLTTLPHTQPLAVTFGLATAGGVLILRRIDRRIPDALTVLVVGLVVSHLLHLRQQGLLVVADLAAIPEGFPPLSVPSLAAWTSLMPAAVACAVLSLVESSSVARAIAAHTHQRIDMTAEFTGQGLANLAASFSGGYPVSGSLARSMLNHQAGAVSRFSSLWCGLIMLVVPLFFGAAIGETPVAGLAGFLLVLAFDLLDWGRMRTILKGTRSDQIAFVATLLGTWTLPLDKAIYLGVGMSLVLFLQRARLLTIREMVIGEKGRFREAEPDSDEPVRRCAAVRVLNVTGSVFFAAAGELQMLMDRIATDPHLRVLILRMRQAEDLDVTTASVLEAASQQLAGRGKTLLLLGVRPAALELLEKTGVRDHVGQENVFPFHSTWHTAMEEALRRALDLVGEHACGPACPFAEYLAEQATLRVAVADTPATLGCSQN